MNHNFDKQGLHCNFVSIEMGKRKKRSTQFQSPLGEGVGEWNILDSLTSEFRGVTDSNPRPQTPWQASLPLSYTKLLTLYDSLKSKKINFV